MVTGFVYASDEEPDLMSGATAGTVVAKISPEPPWIVVNHSLDRILVTRWPGRLFHVAVVEPETAAERVVIDRANNELGPTAGYTRALVVNVIDELDPSIMFGPYGAAVVDVINAAKSLTEEQAARLASARHPRASEAYGNAWRRWLEQPSTLRSLGTDHAPILAVVGNDRRHSPIGVGFTVVFAAVLASAQQRGQPGAAVISDDGDSILAEPWSTAGAALLEAALARGAPDLASRADAGALTAAWHSLNRSS